MISIVVPVYNVEEYIDDCLESLVNQTVGTFEVVLVNDGSEDSSMARASKWLSRLPSYQVINQTNAGLSAARNVGINAAKFDYVMFLDSDDRLSDSAIELLSESVETFQPDCILFSANTFGNSRVSNIISAESDLYSRRCSLFSCPIKGCDYIKTAFKKGCFIKSACMLLYRVSALPNLRFVEGIIHEDNHFTPLLLLNIESVYLMDDCLYERRVREGSITTSKITERNIIGYFTAAQRLRADAKPITECEMDAFKIIYIDILWRALNNIIKINDPSLTRCWVPKIANELNYIENVKLPLKFYLSLRVPTLVRVLWSIKKAVR